LDQEAIKNYELMPAKNKTPESKSQERERVQSLVMRTD
jgi:hypothetical protein